MGVLREVASCFSFTARHAGSAAQSAGAVAGPEPALVSSPGEYHSRVRDSGSKDENSLATAFSSFRLGCGGTLTEDKAKTEKPHACFAADWGI